MSKMCGLKFLVAVIVMLCVFGGCDSQPTSDDWHRADEQMCCTKLIADDVGKDKQLHELMAKVTNLELQVKLVKEKDVILENRLIALETYKEVTSNMPRDCMEIQQSGVTESGVYTVFVGDALQPVVVYCDMKTEGGGWLVFQRRMDGSTDFYLDWNAYAAGFGSLLNEFWLGNRHLHAITSQKDYMLRIDLEDFENETRYAEYSSFAIDGEQDEFALTTLGTYSGTAGDSVSREKGYRFSTKDNDNDVWSGYGYDNVNASCAIVFKGAWWYRDCHGANLNGLYLRGSHSTYADGIEWSSWHRQYYSLKFTEMKIRPVGFN